ncbi:MAG: hypothetical protein ACI3YX_00740 [Prevotella sp.]
MTNKALTLPLSHGARGEGEGNVACAWRIRKKPVGLYNRVTKGTALGLETLSTKSLKGCTFIHIVVATTKKNTNKRQGSNGHGIVAISVQYAKLILFPASTKQN